MKKIIAVSLMLSLSAAIFAGCGKIEDSSSDSDSEIKGQEETTAEVTELESWAPLVTVRERDIVSTNDEFNYEIFEGHAIITSYKGNAEDVVIPDEIGGAPVGEIGFYAFEAKTNLKTVVMPETVTKICECAFCGCTSLYAINIPQNLKEIQRGAFVDCAALTDMTLPVSVTKVCEEAFTGCTGLTSLTIENPDLAYEAWGLEELPNLTVNTPEGSAAEKWASELHNGDNVEDYDE